MLVTRTATTTVDSAQGPGHLLWSRADVPRAVVLLGHGAGGGVDSWDLTALAAGLPEAGVSVVRYVQPWRVAGRRVAVRPPLLDEAWLPAVDAVTADAQDLPLVTGGRSAGARVACRTANATGARGVLCLSFPLHPPGRPDRSRAAELLAPDCPRLVVQGTRDPFGTGEEIRAVDEEIRAVDEGRVSLLEVPDAGHDLRPAVRAGIDRSALRDRLVARVLAWMGELE